MPGKTFHYALNASHTDGRTMKGLKGYTGTKIVTQTREDAQQIARKYLRPGWSIEIVSVDVVTNEEAVVEVIA